MNYMMIYGAAAWMAGPKVLKTGWNPLVGGNPTCPSIFNNIGYEYV